MTDARQYSREEYDRLVADYTVERTRIFREEWLPAINPNEDFSTIPLSYLTELYPHVWAYGPRGDIYVQQLGYFNAELDRLAENWTHEPVFARDIQTFLHDLFKWDGDFEANLQTATHAAYLPQMHLFDPNLDPMHPRTQLLRHPAIQEIDQNYPRHRYGQLGYMESFLNVFTNHSLSRDIIAAMPDEHAQKAHAAFATYCQRWGLPV